MKSLYATGDKRKEGQARWKPSVQQCFERHIIADKARVLKRWRGDKEEEYVGDVCFLTKSGWDRWEDKPCSSDVVVRYFGRPEFLAKWRGVLSCFGYTVEGDRITPLDLESLESMSGGGQAVYNMGFEKQYRLLSQGLSDSQVKAMCIANMVRNAMEDFHHENLSDDQMAELNPIIRNAIYAGLEKMKIQGESMSARLSIMWNMGMIPDYWEPPEHDFKKEDRSYREHVLGEEQAEEAA